LTHFCSARRATPDQFHGAATTRCCRPEGWPASGGVGVATSLFVLDTSADTLLWPGCCRPPPGRCRGGL